MLHRQEHRHFFLLTALNDIFTSDIIISISRSSIWILNIFSCKSSYNMFQHACGLISFLGLFLSTDIFLHSMSESFGHDDILFSVFCFPVLPIKLLRSFFVFFFQGLFLSFRKEHEG